MSRYLIDSNVILDLFLDDSKWADWSIETLTHVSSSGTLVINPVIYTEISIGFDRIEALDEAVSAARFNLEEIPREALFLAGKVFLDYRKRGGVRHSVLPDFFIGAHAAVCGLTLVTRDVSRYRTCYPRLSLVHP